MNHLLDNPVWEALSTTQHAFNMGSAVVKFFPEDIAPFLAMADWNAAAVNTLLQQIPVNRNFSILMAETVSIPPSLKLVFTIPLYQMVCNNFSPVTSQAHQPVELTEQHVEQMLELTAKTKPGPFFKRTYLFGNYIGIIHHNRLAAMAGERLQMPGFTEISAVCAEPEFLGKGYAATLVCEAAAKIIGMGNTPFLHVRQDNVRAIALYKKLGFTIRRNIFFAIFKKEAPFL
ncbi:MAG: GNAT family N-acetyltransferase [Sphingobacteriia bacterium]|nr:GNAT family N-acetyltransferase [Sphingobacteriia bacterium]